MSSFGIQREKKIIPFQKKVSDFTLSRVINLMSCEPLREILYYISEIAIKKGYGKIELSKLGKVRVGVIDGSSFGSIFASVISLVGKIDMPIDLEVYETKGKELPSSKVVIERIEKRFGKGFLTF